jgi:diguanylate cyclase (GGDEF)-like protein
MDESTPANFETAARSVLSFLHRRLGFDLWMVTRTEGEDWIVLQTEDHGYGVASGTVFRWADSFCSRMVEGLGPRIAPRSNDVPAYASAPIGRQVKIGAYVGVPLRRADGALFGTLCAIDPEAQPESIMQEQALVDLLGELLSGLLQAETDLAVEARRSERAEAEALSDGLTSLFNRRGWTRLLEGEENRCRRYGHPAGVIAIDLDGLKTVNDSLGHFAGDELLARVGEVMTRVKREQDLVARVGGDEFVLLAVECDRAGTDAVVNRLRRAFAEAGIRASLGSAMRVPSEGLQRAWEKADQAMYAEKENSRRTRHE